MEEEEIEMYPTRRYVIRVNNMYVSKLEMTGLTMSCDPSYYHELSFKNPIVITTRTPSDESNMSRFAKSIYGKLIEV